MKRKLLVNLLSIVAILFFWQAGFSQNILVNGGMENWTDANTPTGWTTVQGITQETSIVHSGTYSAKQIGGTKKLGQTIDVTSGDSYDISIWYYVASGDGTDARIWSYWKDSGGANITANANELRGPNNVYLPSKASWQNYTATVTAPTNATQLYFEIRTYSKATVYWDDLSVAKAGGGGNTEPPTWTTNFPKVTQVEDTRFTLVVNMSEAGKAYYVVVASGATAPTSAEVKAGIDYSGVSVYTTDSVDVTHADTTIAKNIDGAQPSTSADIYVVAEDTAGNLQSSPVKLPITTTGSRSLTINNPQPNTSYSIRDTINIEWTSANIDSLLIGIYPVSTGIGAAFVTGGPVVAAAGTYKMAIPSNAQTGEYGLVLWDLYDTTFKKVISPITVTDNRELHLTVPKAGDSIYSGDSVTFRWTSAHVDSVYIAIKSKVRPQDGMFIITIKPGSDLDHPVLQAVPASRGYYGFRVPNDADADTLTVYLIDASSNMQFYDSIQPVYVIDTTPPAIKSLTPPPGYQDFPATSAISVQFDSQIVPGTGEVHVKKADGTTFINIPVDSLHFWNQGNGGSSNGFSIWPNELNLVPGQSYYIEMDSALVKDMQGRPFGGLKGNYWNFRVTDKDLYFSEYIEGSGNNKALEVYNPTDHTVSLDNYMIASSYNGSAVKTDSADLYYFPKGTQLAPGKVFVLANSGAVSAVLAVANDTLKYNEGGYVVSFNGNDSRVLIQRVGENGMAWIDQIGEGGNDPGTGWNVAGVTAATKDHTLLRKVNIMIGTTDWGASAGTDASNSQWIVKPKNYFDNLGKPTTSGSDKVEIKGFTLTNINKDNVTLSSIIDSSAATVDVKVIKGTDITNLIPQVSVSDGATILPKSGDTLDFTNPLKFVVTAQNGLATKSWTVTVTEASAPSSKAEITGFSIPNATATLIDDSAHTVTVMLPYNSDVTTLSPEVMVSAGATVSPASGVAQDFTNPVVYTVTAQDGTTTVAWTVTVIVLKTRYVSIHDIQYTTDTSGDSPYKGQMVTTSGVVTALNVYKGVRKGYYIEDKEAAWNGVYVYDTDTTNHVVAVSDSVKITGMVDEYNKLTEIKNLEDFNNFGSGYTRAPYPVTTGTYSNEQWESVLVNIVNATCTNADLGHGEVEVDDGSGAGVLDDYLYPYSTTFILNNVYTVTGIVNYYYGIWTLNPRDTADISNVTGISNNSLADNISIYPNPGNGHLNINLNNTFKGNVTVRVMDMTGRVVYKLVFKNVMNQKLPVDISEQPSSLYFISISNGYNMVVKKFMKR